MKGGKGGSSTPSYKEVVASRGKKPLETVREVGVAREQSTEKGTGEPIEKGQYSTNGIEGEDKIQGTKDKKSKGRCKPKTDTTPKVILNNSELQAHREHMGTYAIICKFMRLSPTEKELQSWIKCHWKPKRSIDLHLGSKGFFTVVFTNIEDNDRVFEGGPYFYATAGLYMRPWTIKFVPEKESFTSMPV